MSGLLSVLYLYIFVLIQLETFALLAGSLGLFIILAMVMYFSKKIDCSMSKINYGVIITMIENSVTIRSL